MRACSDGHAPLTGSVPLETDTIIRDERGEAGRQNITIESKLELAKPICICQREQYCKSPTHFISIPLNLFGDLDEKYSEFVHAARARCTDSFPSSLLMPPMKLHLTVAVMHLSEPERLEAAKVLIARHEPNLRRTHIHIKGLHILEGNRDACRLLYAKVGDTSQVELDNAFAPLLQELAKAGLCGSLATKVQWHCTLMNSKYAKGRPLDVNLLMDNLKDFEFGIISPSQIHLSRMSSTSDKPGYYPAELVVEIGK